MSECYCAKCIYQDTCRFMSLKYIKIDCRFFKDKSLFVELPCKVGDKLFRIFTYKMKIHDYTITEFLFNGNEILIYGEGGYRECAICVDKEIGKTVFLTKEEAEQKLREMENGK